MSGISMALNTTITTTVVPAPTNTSDVLCGGWYTIVDEDTYTLVPITNNGDLESIWTPKNYPTAPDTLTDCIRYRDYDDSTLNHNSCNTIAHIYDVTIDNFLAWNPSLDSNIATCTLQPGYSYCVVLDDSHLIGDSSDFTSESYCLTISAIEPTTVSNCDCFTEVYGYLKGDHQCEDILFDLNITGAELLLWNPWLVPDCDTALYANLYGNDRRAVCIGVDSAMPTSTVTATETTMGSAAATGLD